MHCTTEWIIKTDKNDKRTIVDKLLEIRGIKSEQEKYEFLNPLDYKITSPNVFNDMEKAVERISQAIENKEIILIYGDFDADGVTSTSVLLKTLDYLGAKVDYYIPDRDSEGHGLHSQTLVKILTNKKPKLIITVDNGISNIEEVSFLNSFGRDVIITDHHEAPDELPPAYAIINPKAVNALSDSLSAKQIEYLTYLAGVGVAYKLAQALLEKYNKTEFLQELLPFVAVGTIADIVPLLGENRHLVVKGLELISKGKHYGLKRMLEVAGIGLDNGITADQIAFTIAPRINASGRLDTVENALQVLVSENKQQIEMAIMSLENFNKLRQELCVEVFSQADAIWQNSGMKDDAIVLYSEDWHIGIIGIVASKFVEKYYKPTFIMNYSKENKIFRCSARGVNELNLYDIITQISEHLEGYGGHQLAAGFSFSEDKADFKTIKNELNKTIKEMLNGEKLSPKLDIDLELTTDDIDIFLVDEISKLEPYGAYNPTPTFALKNMILKQKKLMGSTKEHLKLIIDTPQGEKGCIWWSKGDISLINGDRFDVAFMPRLNTFNGNTDIQLIIKDIHSDALIKEPDKEIKIYDHRRKTDIYVQVNEYIKNSQLNIAVFAEDKEIIEELKPYEYISKFIVNRNNIQESEALMFFDYPASEDVFDMIMQKSASSNYHFMNYTKLTINDTEILKNLSGMVKYCCNKQDGKFQYNRAAAALGITTDAVKLGIRILTEAKAFKILENNDEYSFIEYLSPIIAENLGGSIKYEEFVEHLISINEYKNHFMTCSLESLL